MSLMSCYSAILDLLLYFWFISNVIFFFLVFLPSPRHMEVPRLGVQPELQPPAYTTTTATWIRATSATYTTAHGNAGSLNPLSKARD